MTEDNQERDALCPECGHAFKAYVDRLVKQDPAKSEKQKIQCPVCGCNECRIGK